MISLVAVLFCVYRVSALVVELTDGETILIKHAPARFGVTGDYSIEGDLLKTIPSTACEPIVSLNNSIGLAYRGECNFIDKAVNVENAGAKAMIVGDVYTKNTMVTMVSDRDIDVSIPCIFIRGYDHMHLRNFIREQRIKRIVINSTYEVNNKSNPATPYKVHIYPPLIFLFLISALPLSWCMLRGVDAIARRIRTRLNQQRFVNFATTIPEQEYKEPPTDEQDSKYEPICLNGTCVICLEDFKHEEQIIVLPCGHGFHTQCIMTWFERSGSCPICKQQYNQHQASLFKIWAENCCNFSSLYRRIRTDPVDENDTEVSMLQVSELPEMKSRSSRGVSFINEP
mmetsp:Transcript_861/g.1167  ORF Transcript_861/g.1167 Transcript_861/m.1167 type:complete len:342 (+) Transcript_861:185-1210(+)